ncbi:MAG TPA: hypothetical protein DEG76_07640 [Pseudohongiella sp.]|nr:hypothetical protein [Pseudohongiella sp.]
MFVPNLLTIFFLLLLLWAGLLLAKWALHHQSEQYWRLRQLASVDERRRQIYEASRALLQMDTDPEILQPLYETLANDIKTIQRLDPSRSDLDAQLKEAETAGRKRGSGSAGGSAAVATEQELSVAQRHIQRALQIAMDLYKGEKISASQFESARDKLRTLGLRVAVNSSLLMAQKAIEHEDGIRAMSCYRRAESLLGMRGLPQDEKRDKLAYIKAEREKLFANGGRGLLMLASGE